MARVTRASRSEEALTGGWLAGVRAEEKVLRDVQECKAARTVAGHSVDATECAELLEMLGLQAKQGKQARQVLI
jgi:hypothetical protein